MADIPSHSLLGPSRGLQRLMALLERSKASPKVAPKNLSSLVMEVIARDGSFDVLVFIGTATTSSIIATSIATAGQGGDIVFSEFLNKVYDEKHGTETISKFWRTYDDQILVSVPSTIPSRNGISSRSATLFHNSLLSAKSTGIAAFRDPVQKNSTILFCETNRLCYGLYEAEQACLVVFAFHLHPRQTHLAGEFDISIAFGKIAEASDGLREPEVCRIFPEIEQGGGGKGGDGRSSPQGLKEMAFNLRGGVRSRGDRNGIGAEWFGLNRSRWSPSIVKVAAVVKLEGPIQCIIRLALNDDELIARPTLISDPLVIAPGTISPVDFDALTEEDWMSLISTDQELIARPSSMSEALVTGAGKSSPIHFDDSIPLAPIEQEVPDNASNPKALTESKPTRNESSQVPVPVQLPPSLSCRFGTEVLGRSSSSSTLREQITSLTSPVPSYSTSQGGDVSKHKAVALPELPNMVPTLPSPGIEPSGSISNTASSDRNILKETVVAKRENLESPVIDPLIARPTSLGEIVGERTNTLVPQIPHVVFTEPDVVTAPLPTIQREIPKGIIVKIDENTYRVKTRCLCLHTFEDIVPTKDIKVAESFFREMDRYDPSLDRTRNNLVGHPSWLANLTSSIVSLSQMWARSKWASDLNFGLSQFEIRSKASEDRGGTISDITSWLRGIRKTPDEEHQPTPLDPGSDPNAEEVEMARLSSSNQPSGSHSTGASIISGPSKPVSSPTRREPRTDFICLVIGKPEDWRLCHVKFSVDERGGHIRRDTAVDAALDIFSIISDTLKRELRRRWLRQAVLPVKLSRVEYWEVFQSFRRKGHGLTEYQFRLFDNSSMAVERPDGGQGKLPDDNAIDERWRVQCPRNQWTFTSASEFKDIKYHLGSQRLTHYIRDHCEMDPGLDY